MSFLALPLYENFMFPLLIILLTLILSFILIMTNFGKFISLLLNTNLILSQFIS